MKSPILLTTWPFGQAANRSAWPALAAGGSSLDAVEAVCRHVEDDIEVESVGYGGLPDRSGSVTLDALVMQSPARCGGVCALGRHRPAVSVARRVMEASPHVLLAGEGADRFAADQGFTAEPMVSPEARARFDTWVREGRPSEAGHDTVGALAVDAAGVLSGATSTSGRAWKLPGRVGDSPLPGHGLYVDPRLGAAAATGDGELVQGLCSSFAAVQALGRGVPPLEALVGELLRIRDTYELSAQAQVAMIALTPEGRWASAALRPGFRYALAHSEGQEVRDPERVLLG